MIPDMPPDNRKTVIDLDDLEFEFTLKSHSVVSLEPFVTLFSGHVQGWDEKAGEDRVLGNISGSRINLKSARVRNQDQRRILEQLSAEIADFSATILGNETIRLTPHDGVQCIRDGGCNYLIYIAEISIEPEYRCMGLGSTLLSRIPVMMDVNNSTVALKAFPLQFKYGSSSSADEIKRVKRFYEKQGFEYVGGDYMVKIFNQ